jgi:hypothetical protein
MKNILLSQLSPADFKLLEGHLKPTKFRQHDVLFEADQEIRHVYFPTGAVISLVVSLSTGEMVEAATAWSALPPPLTAGFPSVAASYNLAVKPSYATSMC